MYTYIIAGIVVIFVFLWMSNSIRNQSIVQSTSVINFIKKFTYRHIIVILAILVMLFIIPIFTGTLGIILDAIFIIAEILRCYRVISNCRRRQEYIQSLTPNDKCYYTKIHLNPHDNHKLGGYNIHYMFVCPKTQLITFPESKYGNSRKYRLINIKFKPKYGPDYLRLTYNGKAYTRKSLFNDKKNIPTIHGTKIAEIPNIAKLNLKPVGITKPIKIKLLYEVSKNVKHLKYNCIKHNLDAQF